MTEKCLRLSFDFNLLCVCVFFLFAPVHSSSFFFLNLWKYLTLLNFSHKIIWISNFHIHTACLISCSAHTILTANICILILIIWDGIRFITFIAFPSQHAHTLARIFTVQLREFVQPNCHHCAEVLLHLLLFLFAFRFFALGIIGVCSCCLVYSSSYSCSLFRFRIEILHTSFYCLKKQRGEEKHTNKQREISNINDCAQFIDCHLSGKWNASVHSQYTRHLLS